ncbi:MAG: TIGR03560 family F420-dependent LLM class oxidoreductase [Segniliparus sp.]|uniref:TIGR03560 family F420-dependent LLM class oxidoreductase n=1 Tax=Segniliparus sp. TaxID=2804064 RepID=UPI003F30981F
MEFCVFVGPNFGATYEDLAQVARQAEGLGFDGYFVSDHYTAWEGDGLPGPTDAWTTLAGLARETSRLRLGTLVTAATFRHVGPLAVTVAQVDAMSGGRVELGLGTGWLEGEHAAYGIPYPPLGERFELLGETLDVLRQFWAVPVGERFDYEGRRLRLRGSPGLPKPAQAQGPPIILGGIGLNKTPRLAALHAHEFNLPWSPAPDAAVMRGRVREVCEEAGRDPDSMRFSVSVQLGVGRTEAEARARLDPANYKLDVLPPAHFAGSPAQTVDWLGQYGELGIDRFYIRNPPKPGVAEGNLELIAAEVLPQLRR